VCGDVARVNDALIPFFLFEGIAAGLLVVSGALSRLRTPTPAPIAPTG